MHARPARPLSRRSACRCRTRAPDGAAIEADRLGHVLPVLEDAGAVVAAVVLEGLRACRPAHPASALAVELDRRGLHVIGLGVGRQAVVERLGVPAPGEVGGELACVDGLDLGLAGVHGVPLTFSLCDEVRESHMKVMRVRPANSGQRSTVRPADEHAATETGPRLRPPARVRAVDEGKPPPPKKRSLGLSARLPSIQVTPDLLRELEQAAQNQGVTVSAAVRQALRQWLDAQKQS